MLQDAGASIGLQLNSVIACRPLPFVSIRLFATYNPAVPIGAYVVVWVIMRITFAG